MLTPYTYTSGTDPALVEVSLKVAGAAGSVRKTTGLQLYSYTSSAGLQLFPSCPELPAVYAASELCTCPKPRCNNTADEGATSLVLLLAGGLGS